MNEELDVLKVQLWILQEYDKSGDLRYRVKPSEVSSTLKIRENKIVTYLSAMSFLGTDENGYYYHPQDKNLHETLLKTTAKAVETYEKVLKEKPPEEKKTKKEKKTAVATK